MTIRPFVTVLALLFLSTAQLAAQIFVITPNGGGGTTTVEMDTHNPGKCYVTTGGTTSHVNWDTSGDDIRIMDQTGAVNTVLKDANNNNPEATGDATTAAGVQFGTWERLELNP